MRMHQSISRLIEIPANIAGIFAVDRAGRRITVSGGLLIGGLACLITGLVPEGITRRNAIDREKLKQNI